MSGLRRDKENFEKEGGNTDKWKTPKKVSSKKNAPKDKECVNEENYCES